MELNVSIYRETRELKDSRVPRAPHMSTTIFHDKNIHPQPVQSGKMTLSIGHLSGRHVVYGVLRQIAEWTRHEHELLIVGYESSPRPDDISGEHIEHLTTKN